MIAWNLLIFFVKNKILTVFLLLILAAIMTDIFWKVLVHQSRVKIISIFNPQNMKEFSIPKNEDLTLEKEKKYVSSKIIQPIRRQEVEYLKMFERLGTGMKSVIHEISMVSLFITTIFSRKFINLDILFSTYEQTKRYSPK